MPHRSPTPRSPTGLKRASIGNPSPCAIPNNIVIVTFRSTAFDVLEALRVFDFAGNSVAAELNSGVWAGTSGAAGRFSSAEVALALVMDAGKEIDSACCVANDNDSPEEAPPSVPQISSGRATLSRTRSTCCGRCSRKKSAMA